MSALDPRLWLAFVLAVGVSFGAGKWDEHRVSAAAGKVAAATLKTATDRADQAEINMKTIKKAKDEEKSKSDAAVRRLTADLAGLRNRAERRANADTEGAGTVGQCAGASGAELSRPDAEFLTREAARADDAAERLNQCNADYDTVRAAINGLAR